jgi:predicted nucleic acid-binding protein
LIAIDTSSLIAFLNGEAGEDVQLVERALAEHYGCFPPVVLAECLSAPGMPESTKTILDQIPLLPILDGYWSRSGHLRARVLATGHKAKLADSLIAQSCLDHELPLISRDRDFRHFVEREGLRLLG